MDNDVEILSCNVCNKLATNECLLDYCKFINPNNFCVNVFPDGGLEGPKHVE
jgi:hypothetical protein